MAATDQETEFVPPAIDQQRSQPRDVRCWLFVPKTKSGDDFGFLRVKSTFGTRGSQVQILPVCIENLIRR
jgi:pectin methylesterase-like acyl-CoA thioesterase